MDKIFVTKLQAEAIIGCLPWERRIKQKLLLSFELGTDAALIRLTDQITQGHDYAKISERVRQFVENSEYQLIETLADHLAELLQTEFNIKNLRLTVEKPGALPEAQTVGITIERTKA